MWNWIKLDIDYCLRAKLSSGEIATLALLASHASPDQLVTVPYSVLANRLHVTRRSVIRYIASLKTAGMIQSINRSDRDRYAVLELVAGVASGRAQPRRPRDLPGLPRVEDDAQTQLPFDVPVDIDQLHRPSDQAHA